MPPPSLPSRSYFIHLDMLSIKGRVQSGHCLLLFSLCVGNNSPLLAEYLLYYQIGVCSVPIEYVCWSLPHRQSG